MNCPNTDAAVLSACGADCMACELRAACRGCIESCGKPFGRTCMVFSLYEKGDDVFSAFRQKLIDTINRLEIDGLEPVTELYALKGSFINPAVTLPNGDAVKFLDDNKIYLGTQMPKRNSSRFLGLAADTQYLMVCEYGENGADAKLILFTRWSD